ncbi:MAG: bifunctional 4-hydroxy-2-oxoglutarate aldolase/2-dehydro-3-deoxy-phosphogluconate aldolase [Opitutales bacterium]|nr:bifunctional 4-hydroxy-2-oxoglutarate aldolase/2-dehydro-3-deoxy-phosphogluconate aldolase [Opitutales bacterium]
MEKITQTRLVPVAVIHDVADAVPLARTLSACGVDLIEVTLRTPAAIEAIRAIRAELPDMMVGAGTLLDIYQVEEAVKAGALFGVSPGINRSVVEKAHELELPFVPGACTPSDVEKGLSLGCKLQKFFPAEAAGGIPMLKAMAGPYQHTGLKFIPLGGVKANNAADYIKLPTVAAIGGSWFVDAKLVQAKNWKEIEKLTKEAVQMVRQA